MTGEGGADRGNLVRHSGQYFSDVARLDRAAESRQLAGDVQEAAEVAGEDRIGAGRNDLGRLVGDHLVGDFRVFDAERAAKPAAYFGLCQLKEAQPLDRSEQSPRLRL